MNKHKFNIYPEIPAEQISELYASIEKGYNSVFPIVTYEGEVLDGWNRWLVCEELSITPTIEEFEGTDLEAIHFIDASNARRDLNTFQRTEIALQREETFRELAKENLKLSQGRGIKGPPTLANLIEPIETRQEVAKIAGTSHGTLDKAKTIIAKAPEEAKEKLRAGETTINKVYQDIKREERNQKAQAVRDAKKPDSFKAPFIQVVNQKDWLPTQPDYDLLLTDPPYMTDVEDITDFVHWLPEALAKVKDTGRAYVFVGAYPEELAAYLFESQIVTNMQLIDILVWTYRNTLGPSPKFDYKSTWQAALYFRAKNAPPLDCPIMTEQFNVQDINAPDGRMGNRFHKWQKPDEIAERFIRHSTKKGDLVCDPFAGTGTFLLAASRLERKAIGCELDLDILQIAKKRGCLVG